MTIQIQTIHFSANQELIDFVNKKINKLISIDDSILNAEVYLKVEKPLSHRNKIAEIKLHSSIHKYFAKKKCNTFEESTDLAIQALRKQILKQKLK